VARRSAQRIGFHVSIAGGIDRAVGNALQRKCTTFQIFCGNPRGWRLRPRAQGELDAFRAARAEAGLDPLFVHACYLINPCAPDALVYRRSVRRLAAELEASVALGAQFYVLHPGSCKGKQAGWAVRRAAQAIARALTKVEFAPLLLLEGTAGPHGPGGGFDTMSELLDRIHAAVPEARLGVALDSCHAWAAGYDFRRPDEVDRLAEEMDRSVGLNTVRLLHLNDSRDQCGSRRDRHEHIGRGTIGRRGLGNLLRHPAMRRLPLILETPGESAELDLRNRRAALALLSRG